MMQEALVWIEFREFIAEGRQFPHTKILYVTLGIIDLKYISSSDCLGRNLIFFNDPTFCVKGFFTESMCTDHERLLLILTPRQVVESTRLIRPVPK